MTSCRCEEDSVSSKGICERVYENFSHCQVNCQELYTVAQSDSIDESQVLIILDSILINFFIKFYLII